MTGPGPDQAESFLQKVRDGLDDLLEVKVVTLVGNLGVTITTEGKATTTTLTSTTVTDEAIVTVVKLLDGDVTTVIPPALLANAELRALHAAQVASSLDVLPRHVRELVDVAKALLDR